jgi:hypothetical protein
MIDCACAVASVSAWAGEIARDHAAEKTRRVSSRIGAPCRRACTLVTGRVILAPSRMLERREEPELPLFFGNPAVRPPVERA